MAETDWAWFLIPTVASAPGTIGVGGIRRQCVIVWNPERPPPVVATMIPLNPGMRMHDLKGKGLAKLETLARKRGVDLDLENHGDRIQIVWLDRSSSPKGTGAEVMQMVCDYADRAQRRLVLSVWEGEPKLIAFYQRFGFEMTGDPDEDEPIMEREPKGKA